MRMVSLPSVHLMGQVWVANRRFGSGETYWTEAELQRHLKREGFVPKERLSAEM
jgi:hypothetical protein